MTGASFIGLEQRVHLVRAACDAAFRVGVCGRATFVCGTLDAVRWSAFDAFYLYNPFAENLFPPRSRLDDTQVLSPGRFLRDVAATERALARVRVGSRVVTYHGFGGSMPSTFRLVHRERAGSDWLELWIKSSDVVFSVIPALQSKA
jgi:hypothetical protein